MQKDLPSCKETENDKISESKTMPKSSELFINVIYINRNNY